MVTPGNTKESTVLFNAALKALGPWERRIPLLGNYDFDCSIHYYMFLEEKEQIES
jgi:hypothetical protein